MGSRIPEEVLESIVKDVCRRYRIMPDAARRVIEGHLDNDARLKRRIEKIDPGEDISRLHEFKEAVKDARKEIYHNLRRYHRDKEAMNNLVSELARRIGNGEPSSGIEHVRDELLLLHSSTAERYEHYGEFYEELFRYVEYPGSVIDVACGLHPLSYPFDRAHPERYVAIDRDKLSIDAVNAISALHETTKITGVHSDIADIEWGSLGGDDVSRYDLCFMLKLLPVVRRQSGELIRKLADVPARRILITANAEALTRRVRISHREDKALREFIELTGRSVTADFKIANEFGYILE